MKTLWIWALISFFSIHTAFSQEVSFRKEGMKDLVVDSWDYLIHGALEQFKTKNNLYYAAAATGALWYSFEEDDRLSLNFRNKEKNNFVEFVGVAGIPLNFPIIPIAAFYYGQKKKNSHHVQFAKEYMAAMYLT